MTELSQLRAIDIPGTINRNAIQTWFFSNDAMKQFLASRTLYGDDDGSIRNTDGDIVGIWYFAEFSAKNPAPKTRSCCDYMDDIPQKTLAQQEAEDRNEVIYDDFDIRDIDAELDRMVDDEADYQAMRGTCNNP